MVAIEVREGNFKKACFSKEVLGLENFHVHLDDVRNLSVEKYGKFDVVLCLGILYHLDFEDVVRFLESIQSVTTGFGIFHTHISSEQGESFIYNGREYWGTNFREHQPEASKKDKEKSLWASIDNLTSYWPTRSSLYNLFADVGFTSAYECNLPYEPQKDECRVAFVAINGTPQQLKCCPTVNDMKAIDMPEEKDMLYNQLPEKEPFKMTSIVPRPIKDAIKKIIK